MKSPVIAHYSDNPQSESDAESIAELVALSKVRNYTAAMDWRQLLTTFTGDSPMCPANSIEELLWTSRFTSSHLMTSQLPMLTAMPRN